MFANLSAIALLVQSDAQASAGEKSAVLALLSGDAPRRDGEVVSFARAAEILGYKGVRGVRKALQSGVIRGFYGGRNHARCTGIVLDSIYAAIGKSRQSA